MPYLNNIYVYTANGDIIELPIKSTPIDFAYKIHTKIGNHIFKCFVNGDEVPLSYKLKNKDRIIVIVNDKCKPEKRWINIVKTTLAKKKIKDYFKKK